MANWILYGANGYTGRLLLEEALKRGEKPTLAGRTESSVRPLAERHDLPHRVFALDTPERIAEHLDDQDALLLAAGPFSATSAPAVGACLLSKTHYLDITGEVGVFEACARRDEEAKSAGIVLMPGTGFDVVPTDCLANALKDALPDADRLVLAFAGVGTRSPGTTKTMVENLPEGGLVRRNGDLKRVPTAWQTLKVPFHTGSKTAISIPWGDVSTAYRSTGIPNIDVYMAMPEKQIRSIRGARPFLKVLSFSPVRKIVNRVVDRNVKGPTADERAHGKSSVWGRVVNPDGVTVEGWLETIEGYALTAITGIDLTLRVAAGEAEPGFRTPAMAFGADYVRSVRDTEMEVGERSGA